MIIKFIVFISLFSIVWSNEVDIPAECNPFGCQCQYGTKFFISKDNCFSCSCKPHPCSLTVCPANTICQVDSDSNTAKCVSRCKECICRKTCSNGLEYDKDGCPICKCLEPCASVTCPKFRACVVKKSNCTNFSADCQPYNGVCRSCSALYCKRACQYGFVYIAENCPVCECIEPCANVNCPSGSSCVPVKTNCETYSADCQEYKGVCQAA